MAEGADLIKFLIENVGVVATILLLIAIVPCAMVVILARIISKMLNSHDTKLDEIENSMKELTGLVKGTMEVVKWVLQRGGLGDE